MQSQSFPESQESMACLTTPGFDLVWFHRIDFSHLRLEMSKSMDARGTFIFENKVKKQFYYNTLSFIYVTWSLQ